MTVETFCTSGQAERVNRRLAAYLRGAVARGGDLSAEETERLIRPVQLSEQPIGGGARPWASWCRD